jgi:hypothetical protein
MAISNKAPVAIAYPEIDYDKLLIVKHIIEGWIDEDGQVQGSMTLTLQAYRTLPDGRNELDPRGPKQEVVPDVFNPTLPTSLSRTCRIWTGIRSCLRISNCWMI